jgi:hypothetical protein
MIRHDVGFDLIGTRPHETAEWAWALVLVFLPHVSIALLDSSKVFIAAYTDGPWPSAHGTSPLVLFGYGTWNVGIIPTGSMGLCLRYDVIVHSNHSNT